MGERHTVTAGARRWLMRPTVLLAVPTVAFLVVMIVVALNIHTDRPKTEAGVAAEIAVEIDAIEDSLPAAADAVSSEKRTVAPCPDGSANTQVHFSRFIAVAADFDRLDWLNELSARYDAQGWSVSERTNPTGGYHAVTVVGPPLLIYKVAELSPGGNPHLVITASSRCTGGL